MLLLLTAIAVNLALAVGVAAEVARIRKCISAGRRVRATVVEFFDWPGDPQITPILELRDSTGAPLRVRTRYGSGAYTSMKGKEIDAIYVDGGSFALVDTFSGRWGSVFVLGVFQVISLTFLVLVTLSK